MSTNTHGPNAARKTVMLVDSIHTRLSELAKQSKVGRHVVIEALLELVPEERLVEALAKRKSERGSKSTERKQKRELLKQLASKLSVEDLQKLAAENVKPN